MMKINNKTIKYSAKPQLPIKTIPNIKVNCETPIILFTYFNGHSVRTNDFNNFYINREKSMDAVNSFINKIKIIQKMEIKELFDLSNKRQLHCHPVEGEQEIKRINDVLLNGYKFSLNVITNFENNYFEFSLDNGSRIFFVRVENYFELLFIDNNHLIYKESSRFVKHKEKYNYPSCFGKIDFEKKYDEMTIKEVVELMIMSYKNNEITGLEDFVNNLEELIKYNEICEEKDTVNVS